MWCSPTRRRRSISTSAGGQPDGDQSLPVLREESAPTANRAVPQCNPSDVSQHTACRRDFQKSSRQGRQGREEGNLFALDGLSGLGVRLTLRIRAKEKGRIESGPVMMRSFTPSPRRSEGRCGQPYSLLEPHREQDLSANPYEQRTNDGWREAGGIRSKKSFCFVKYFPGVTRR